ncbi:phosphate ABC transporter substrate-binding protein PstS family protein [Schleiferilactobacillus shenzhenensis]|uniref:Phosphate-binding protein n=1 Tax=Schleiferilactobacillus shenzhenensis LY-73 TaxID=1231336 RepID=U4TWI0_9LACO|nr:phosphate ABC transporter substrate-binding protein PstS family protein [Schleiferilactobacillus shenzhenensis]ERL66198.1 PstS1 [Schleiferilactobacillus shenzhenensis LY-73]
MKHIKLWLLAALSLFLLAGCQQQGAAITAVGSSALQPLVEAAGERYSAEHSGEFINVQGGGSGTGLSQIQSGAVDIGNSDLYAEEKKGIDAKKLVDHRVAVVGVVPIVNQAIPLDNLSMAQLRGIFSGQYTNWSQVGGPNIPIVIVNRASGSGTRVTFERWVMNNVPTKAAQEQDSTGMVRQIVATTPGAISYVAFPYVDKTVKTLKLDGVAPTDANVQTNKWVIWSYEHMYTKGAPKGLAKKFINYVMSDTVQQKIVTKLGYIAVNDMKVSRSLTGQVTKRAGQ